MDEHERTPGLTTYCRACGGQDVQVAMWVSVNENNKVDDDYGSSNNYDTTWCYNCEDHLGVTVDVSAVKDLPRYSPCNHTWGPFLGENAICVKCGEGRR